MKSGASCITEVSDQGALGSGRKKRRHVQRHLFYFPSHEAQPGGDGEVVISQGDKAELGSCGPIRS